MHRTAIPTETKSGLVALDCNQLLAGRKGAMRESKQRGRSNAQKLLSATSAVLLRSVGLLKNDVARVLAAGLECMTLQLVKFAVAPRQRLVV